MAKSASYGEYIIQFDRKAYDSIQCNYNRCMKKHTDRINRGPSLIFAVGDYTNGDLTIHRFDPINKHTSGKYLTHQNVSSIEYLLCFVMRFRYPHDECVAILQVHESNTGGVRVIYIYLNYAYRALLDLSLPVHAHQDR